MHVAESPEESEMYLSKSGSMFLWLKGQRDMSDCGARTPVQQLHRCGLLGENLLAVHVNYASAPDIQLLANARVSVAHCPRSHAYFGYAPFPYEALAAAGVNICLGTDSLASVKRIRGEKLELNLFTEMGQFASERPEVSPDTILEMATVNGARALGLGGLLGQISPGALADLIVLPFRGKTSEACAAVVDNWRDVRATMIGGKWI